jgi:hypothetical protein
MCVKTEGLLLLGVHMKGEDRQGTFVVLSRRVSDLADKMAPELGQVKRVTQHNKRPRVGTGIMMATTDRHFRFGT